MKKHEKKLLVVDDKSEIRNLVRYTLEYEGWEITEAENGEEAVAAAARHAPDLVIMDMMMPGKLNGIAAAKEILANPASKNCKIVMLSGADPELRDNALEAGISEFIQKPFSPLDLIEKTESLSVHLHAQTDDDEFDDGELAKKEHDAALEELKNEAASPAKMRGRDSELMTAQASTILRDLHSVNKELRHKISELENAKSELHKAYKGTINRLVVASEYKDNETGAHVVRISTYSAFLAALCGLTESEVEEIELAASMHDVGKIGIKDSILFKNGKLTDEEFNDMKRHTTIGSDILKNADSPILECARLIALNHHEKWDGRGYPNGVAGEDIPIQARIVSICDTFDALTSKRPYKNPYPVDVACDIIKKGHGTDFDPAVVDLFIANIDEIIAIKNRINATCGAEEEEIKINFKWSERDLDQSTI